MKWRALILSLSLALPCAAADQGSGGLAPYIFEVTPLMGINLPNDLWSSASIFRVYGVRTGYSLTSLGGAGTIEAGGLYQADSGNKIMTTDFGYRYEFVKEGLNAFFSVGFHISNFTLNPSIYPDGTCVISGCQTDSGRHSGIYLGGGVMFPITPKTVFVFDMRFYNNPQVWLLLDLGVEIRL